jgi:hypothetical protein
MMDARSAQQPGTICPNAVRERYRGSLKAEKLRILDEFVAVTGYHRKHIIPCSMLRR